MSKERIDDEGLSNISGGGAESAGSPEGEAVTTGPGPGGGTGSGAEKQDPGSSVEGNEGPGNMGQN